MEKVSVHLNKNYMNKIELLKKYLSWKNVFIFMIVFIFLFWLSACMSLFRFYYRGLEVIIPEKEVTLIKTSGERLFFGGEYSSEVLIKFPDEKYYNKVIENIRREDDMGAYEEGLLETKEGRIKRFDFIPSSLRTKFGNKSLFFDTVSYVKNGRSNQMSLYFSEDKQYVYIIYGEFAYTPPEERTIEPKDTLDENKGKPAVPRLL